MVRSRLFFVILLAGTAGLPGWELGYQCAAPVGTVCGLALAAQNTDRTSPLYRSTGHDQYRRSRSRIRTQICGKRTHEQRGPGLPYLTARRPWA